MTDMSPASPRDQVAQIHYWGRRITGALTRSPDSLTGAQEDLLEAYALMCGVAEYTEDRADRDDEHAQGLHTAGPEVRCPSCEREQAARDEAEAHDRNDAMTGEVAA